MIELLVLGVCCKVIIESVRSGNREVQNRDLRRTFKNLTVPRKGSEEFS